MPSGPKWVFDTVERLTSKMPSAEVTETVYLSNTLKKIRFKGNLENIAFTVGSFIDFRVSDTEARRYTVSYADSETGIFEFIVHLHGKGPGSDFMDNLKVGDIVDLNKPRTIRRYYEQAAERFVVFGDETSLGLACSFLPVLKKYKHQCLFIFELDEENRNIPQLLGLETCLVFAKDGSFRNEEWIDKLPVMKTASWQDAYCVLTGNAKSAQVFRKVIKERTNAKVYLHGYWVEGRKGL